MLPFDFETGHLVGARGGPCSKLGLSGQEAWGCFLVSSGFRTSLAMETKNPSLSWVGLGSAGRKNSQLALQERMQQGEAYLRAWIA